MRTAAAILIALLLSPAVLADFPIAVPRSVPARGSLPAIASDGHDFLATWTDGRTVSTTRIGLDGTPSDDDRGSR